MFYVEMHYLSKIADTLLNRFIFIGLKNNLIIHKTLKIKINRIRYSGYSPECLGNYKISDIIIIAVAIILIGNSSNGIDMTFKLNRSTCFFIL